MDEFPAEDTLQRPVVRRAPLVVMAVAMAGGIVAGRYLRPPIGLWGVIGIGAFVAAAAVLRREHLRAISISGIAVAIFCAAAAAAALAYHHVPANHLLTFSGESSVLATIRGQVFSKPQVRRSRTALWLPARTVFLLKASAIRASRARAGSGFAAGGDLCPLRRDAPDGRRARRTV